MSNGEIIYWLVQLSASVYMLGLGYQFLPDPGKKGSIKNKEYFNKFRDMFRIGGFFLLFYVVFSVISNLLA